MELRTDLMKMGELERLAGLLTKYKKVPDEGLFYGLTDNAKESFWDHDDEEKWNEMLLLFVTPTFEDIQRADTMFKEWAATTHPGKPVVCVTDPPQPGQKRYWIYILR